MLLYIFDIQLSRNLKLTTLGKLIVNDRLGGALSHIVVMQHVSKELLTDFLSEVKAEPGTK